ncbi:transposase [Nonomuraea angiospora]|uniref:transposase n=1 Tax=Nonomuraea angiospora TaxID=46172 RepID=UPI0038D4AC3C
MSRHRADVPDPAGLAQTASTWQYAIANAILLGVSNPTSERTNHVFTLVGRIAFGFRNPVNQRRARYAKTRVSRRPTSSSGARTRSPKVIM